MKRDDEPRRSAEGNMHRDEGMTLVELLSTFALIAIIVTLAAPALRNFWLVRSLDGAQSEATTQLRQLQERVVAESHPLVYGARFEEGSSNWALVRYNPTSGTCSAVETRSFSTGVEVSGASFQNLTENSINISSLCKGTATDVVFFLARGTATPGFIQLTQPALDRSTTLCVRQLTGRVDEETADEPCPVVS
jgi:Tfp pilus assembly protein FimT